MSEAGQLKDAKHVLAMRLQGIRVRSASDVHHLGILLRAFLVDMLRAIGVRFVITRVLRSTKTDRPYVQIARWTEFKKRKRAAKVYTLDLSRRRRAK